MHTDSPSKTLARKIARKLGIKWSTDWEIRVRRDAQLTAALLSACLREDSCCADIGANKGEFLEQFVRLAPHGRHLAVEPIPAHAHALAERYPHVEILDCALSDKEGQVIFYHVQNRDAWSGLRKQRYPTDAKPVEITVNLQRLDAVVGDLRQVDFMKIDVEGAEYEVLLGAQGTINRCHPIILFEHAKLHNENYHTTPAMVYELLVDTLGMTISDLRQSQIFGKDEFIDLYEASYASNYDRQAQTNFVARFR